MISRLLMLLFGLSGQWLLGTFIAKCLMDLQRAKLSAKSQGFTTGDQLESSQPVVSPSRLAIASNNQIPTAEIYGLGIILGIGLTAWSLFVWSDFGGLLGLVPSCVIAILGYATSLPTLFSSLKRIQIRTQKTPRLRIGTGGQSTAKNVAISSRERPDFAVARACQLTITFLFVVATFQILQTPQKLWDERAIFAIKSKVLFEDRSINSPSLLHPDFVQYHPRYPLLLPLAESNVYSLLGVVDDRLSKLLFAFLYLGLVVTSAGVFQRHFSPGKAWFGATLMATVPVMMPWEYGFLCGQADAPTACFHGLSVLYLWDALTRQRNAETSFGSLVAAGICGSFAAFTKDEGIAFLMIDTSILGLFAVCSMRQFAQFRISMLGITSFAGIAVAILIPWFAHRRNLPITTEMNYFERMSVSLLFSRLQTLSWSLPHLFHRMFYEWREWGLHWWVMLLSIIGRPSFTLKQSQTLCLLDIAGSIAALLVAGILAPAQLDEHIGGSSHRFLMQISPVAVLFAVTQLFSKSERGIVVNRAKNETV